MYGSFIKVIEYKLVAINEKNIWKMIASHSPKLWSTLSRTSKAMNKLLKAKPRHFAVNDMVQYLEVCPEPKNSGCRWPRQNAIILKLTSKRYKIRIVGGRFHDKIKYVKYNHLKLY